MTDNEKLKELIDGLLVRIEINFTRTNELIEKLGRYESELYYKMSDRITELEFELTNQISKGLGDKK